MIDKLIKLENFSLSYSLTQKLSVSTKYPRLTGFVPLFFTPLVDATVHAGTGIGKTLTGLIATPYNCVVSEERAFNQTLTLRVAIMHLALAIENIFNAAILPFINLYSPHKAEEWIRGRIESNHKLFDRNFIEELRRITPEELPLHNENLNRIHQLETDLDNANQTIRRQTRSIENLEQADRQAQQVILQQRTAIQELERERINNQHDFQQQRTAFHVLETEYHNLRNSMVPLMDFLKQNHPELFPANQN